MQREVGGAVNVIKVRQL